jgi:hypothetical protein
MKNSLRRAATSFVTGSTGRLVAFLTDVSIASARYWNARARGRQPW